MDDKDKLIYKVTKHVDNNKKNFLKTLKVHLHSN